MMGIICLSVKKKESTQNDLGIFSDFFFKQKKAPLSSDYACSMGNATDTQSKGKRWNICYCNALLQCLRVIINIDYEIFMILGRISTI